MVRSCSRPRLSCLSPTCSCLQDNNNWRKSCQGHWYSTIIEVCAPLKYKLKICQFYVVREWRCNANPEPVHVDSDCENPSLISWLWRQYFHVLLVGIFELHLWTFNYSVTICQMPRDCSWDYTHVGVCNSKYLTTAKTSHLSTSQEFIFSYFHTISCTLLYFIF